MSHYSLPEQLKGVRAGFAMTFKSMLDVKAVGLLKI